MNQKKIISFIKRVLNYFNSEKFWKKTTGILLAGTKRYRQKTMLSKRIALESNLPIIIVAK